MPGILSYAEASLIASSGNATSSSFFFTLVLLNHFRRAI
jgi:hypothetical protein